MKRRALLASAGVAIAGCQTVLPDDEQPLRLGILEIHNHVESTQQLEIEVYADSELTHEAVVSLAAAEPSRPSGDRLEKNWPDQANSYTLRIDADIEDDRIELTLDERIAETCEMVLLSVRPERLTAARDTRGECY